MPVNYVREGFMGGMMKGGDKKAPAHGMAKGMKAGKAPMMKGKRDKEKASC